MLGKKSKDGEAVATRPAAVGPTDDSVSFVGKSMKVTGSCTAAGKMRIAGTISGDIQARGLELLESGSVEGDVSAPKGERIDDVFVISGRVDGTVRAPRVEVRKTGTVLGGIVAEHATIHGRIEGGIEVKTRLSLEETAVVEGDVRAGRLALKDGGQVNGTIVMGGGAKARAEADTSPAPALVSA